ncbi:MAG TPA: response regulator transcription factor [Anaerolineales bacterium]|nr:response regulator transcription factor [Anaerolineales bacterium]
MNENLRILIVDDSPRARDGLSAFISMQAGLRVVSEAANGEDALARIEGQDLDLVLMDIEMPVMDGLRATQIIKKRWPHIRVIVLTLYTEYRARAQQAGADAFLVKGCSMEELRTTLCAEN